MLQIDLDELLIFKERDKERDEKKMKQIATNLLKSGVSVKIVAQSTNLPEAYVQGLKDSLGK